MQFAFFCAINIRMVRQAAPENAPVTGNLGTADSKIKIYTINQIDGNIDQSPE